MYQVDRTDASNTPVLVDNSKVTTQLGLRWVGQYYSRYGEIQHENIMRLLENFASDNEPGVVDDAGANFNHIEGQLWFHTNDYDHSTKNILKIYDDNKFEGTDGWKRTEVIMSDTMPVYHTEGETWFDYSSRTLSFSNGPNWQDVTVKIAMDSKLLDGLQSTQFLRSDVDDIMYGLLDMRNHLFPGNHLSHRLGFANNRWSEAFCGVLDTNFSRTLTPELTNAFDLGQSFLRWRNLNVVTLHTEFSNDLNPIQDNQQILGRESARWKSLHVNTLNANQTTHLIPIDGTRSLGDNTHRWNQIYGNYLNVNSTHNLIPISATNLLGNSTNGWNELYVNKVFDTTTQSLVPMADKSHNLGSATSEYLELYVYKMASDTIYDGNLKFHIPTADRSYGLQWKKNLNQTAVSQEIYTERFNGTDTRLVIESGDTNEDYLSMQHNGVEKMTVKEDIVDVSAGTLRTRGKLQIEDTTTASGCEMEYNESTQILEFRFY